MPGKALLVTAKHLKIFMKHRREKHMQLDFQVDKIAL
jgi:hypothetical protein